MNEQMKNPASDSYEIVIEPEAEGGYHVCAPALKGCHSYGATREEALSNIAEAIELWLTSAQELGIPVPQRHTVTIKVK